MGEWTSALAKEFGVSGEGAAEVILEEGAEVPEGAGGGQTQRLSGAHYRLVRQMVMELIEPPDAAFQRTGLVRTRGPDGHMEWVLEENVSRFETEGIACLHESYRHARPGGNATVQPQPQPQPPLPPAVPAVAQSTTPLPVRIGKCEELVLGSISQGALMSRVAALEEAWGISPPSRAGIPMRVGLIEQALRDSGVLVD